MGPDGCSLQGSPGLLGAGIYAGLLLAVPQKSLTEESSAVSGGRLQPLERGGELRSREPVPSPLLLRGVFRGCLQARGRPPVPDRGAGSEVGSEPRVLTTRLFSSGSFTILRLSFRAE